MIGTPDPSGRENTGSDSPGVGLDDRLSAKVSRVWQAEARDSKYLPSLDGLRALAVIGVLYSHFWDAESLAGDVGVRLFFVLSGYLITRMVIAAKANGSRRLGNFYIRRCLRLWPAYYGLVLFLAATNFGMFRSVAMWHALHASNVLFALRQAYVPFYTAAWWSLAVEEQFYLVWPAIVMWTSHRTALLLSIMAIPAALIFRVIGDNSGWAEQTYLLLPGSIDALGAGAILALCEYRGWRIRVSRLVLLVSVVMLATIVALSPAEGAWLSTVVLAATAVIVVAAVAGFAGLVGAILTSPILVYLGRISFGIYLYHLFVWAILLRLFGWTVFGERGALLFVTCGGLTILVASLSWFILELPFNRLKHRFPFPLRSDLTAPPLASDRAAY